MKRQSRQGFTLFHLLIVLALLLIVIALLLPAIQKVRAAAARAQSQNNLKQIALAVHNYHDIFGAMPSGNDANNFSASAYLLPYIEQAGVFNTIDFKKPMDDKANRPARQLVIKVFLNPMDPVRSVTPDYGPTNYLFSAGTKASLEDNDGVFYQNSKVKLPDITDGTSNTVMAGETLKGDGGMRAMTVARQHVRLKAGALKGLKDDSGVNDFKNDKHIASDRCASWMDGRFLQGTFTGTRTINDAKPDVDCGGIGGLSGLRAVQGQAGVNVALCDGSVRFVSVAITPVTWKAAITRNGGEVLGADW